MPQLQGRVKAGRPSSFRELVRTVCGGVVDLTTGVTVGSLWTPLIRAASLDAR